MGDLVNVKGLADLQKMLDQIPALMERNVMRGALRAGANEVKKEAQTQLKSNGSVKSSTLLNGLKVSTAAKGAQVTASVKVKGKHAYIARWLEYTGAAPHVIRPKNAKALAVAGKAVNKIEHPGFKAKPFLRPAMDIAAATAVVAVGEAIKKRLATKHGIDTADVDIGEV